MSTISSAALKSAPHGACKSLVGRCLPRLRIFCCGHSEGSAGVREWITENYHEVKLLNPSFPILVRTGEDVEPAVLTDFRFRENDVVNQLLSTDALSHDPSRVAAAYGYLSADLDSLRKYRFAYPGFDPERPHLDEEEPDWRRENPERLDALMPYLEVRDKMKSDLALLKDGPEWENAVKNVYDRQRVNLSRGCGPEEVTEAIRSLMVIGAEGYGTELIEYERPDCVADYYPGVDIL